MKPKQTTRTRSQTKQPKNVGVVLGKMKQYLNTQTDKFSARHTKVASYWVQS